MQQMLTCDKYNRSLVFRINSYPVIPKEQSKCYIRKIYEDE